MCVGVIDLAAVKRDRDQLWAEAVDAEAGGEPLVIPERLWPDVAVKRSSFPHNSSSQGSSSIRASCWMAADKGGSSEWRASTDYLLTDVLSVPKERQNNNHTKRLASIMRRLGWIRSEEVLRFGKVVKRGFKKPCE